MTFIYRLFSLVINTVAILLCLSFLFSIPMLFSSTLTMLSAFMIISVILYSWFSFRFRREVMQRHLEVSRSLRDWVRVNGFVSIFFSVLTVMNILYLLQNPNQFAEALKNYHVAIDMKSLTGFFYAMLAYGVFLLTHILWTFALMKKNERFFI